MREIKFRAWNDRKKTFVFGPRDNEVNASWVLAMCSANEMQPEQFTGLRDKYGVEVYEGDILNWCGLAIPVTVSEQHGFRFMFGEDQLCVAFAYSGEIIGNIHQNPELLK